MLINNSNHTLKDTLIDKDTIKEQDFNESHYWHTIMDVVQLMRKHGYLSVMENINSVLHNIKDISYK